MTEKCLNLEKNVSICVWNLNGIQNKFLSNDVYKLLDEKEVIIIIETHFGIRSKCPQNFSLVARSQPRESKKITGWCSHLQKI